MTAGIDIGSTATKAVIFDGAVRAEAVVPTGWNPREAASAAYRAALKSSGFRESDVEAICGTGYGRISVPFVTRRVTEITCHARGAGWLVPGTSTVIDIGGQDTKVISVAPDGSVTDFIMNDKCAAGTGRFLQVMTGILDVTLDELGELAAGAEPVKVNSMCAVFAETEVIGLLARGIPKDAIAAGVIAAVAERVKTLAAKMGCGEGATFSGGVAVNAAIRGLISKALGMRLHVPANPQMVGAVGAAIIAAGA